MGSHSSSGRKPETESPNESAVRICIDCSWDGTDPNLTEYNGDSYCQHFTPAYGESQGYFRGWGDAAVMNWPGLEILIKPNKTRTEFIVLAPFSQRRPVILYAEGGGWGMY